MGSHELARAGTSCRDSAVREDPMQILSLPLDRCQLCTLGRFSRALGVTRGPGGLGGRGGRLWKCISSARSKVPGMLARA